MSITSKLSGSALALALVIGFNASPAQAADVVDTAIDTPELSTLVELVVAADLVGALKGLEEATVFAPTNDAFGKLPRNLSRAIANDTDGSILTSILTYHVVNGATIKSTDIVAVKRTSVETLQGTDVRARSAGKNVFINNAKVVLADVETDNAIVHVINRVLIPWHDRDFRKDVISALKHKNS